MGFFDRLKKKPSKAWPKLSPAVQTPTPSGSECNVVTLAAPGIGKALRSPAVVPEADPDEGHWDSGHGIKYKSLKKLGPGGLSRVYLAENQATHEQVVVRFWQRSSDIKFSSQDMEIFTKISHPVIIQFKEAFLTADRLAIVLECVPGQDLVDYVQQHGKLDEDHVRWIFQQLIHGVDSCHKAGLVNMDLKPEAIRVKARGNHKPSVKICHFGIFNNMEKGHMLMSHKGCPECQAPETMEGVTDKSQLDMWSLGCILYFLLYGCLPFFSAGDQLTHDFSLRHQSFKRWLKGEYAIPSDTDVSPDAINLLQRLLVVRPDERMFMAQMWADPWFRQGLPQQAQLQDKRMMCRHETHQTAEQIASILAMASQGSDEHA